MKPATRHYLIVDQGIVTAKRALGADQRADGSWTMPPAPASGVLVAPDVFIRTSVGDVLQNGTYVPGTRGRVDERLARLEAQCIALARRVRALERA